MSYFTKHLRLLAIAAAFALAAQPLASLSTPTDAHAHDLKELPSAVIGVAEGGSSAGGWIIGGLFISVASIIACAMIVGSEEGREMTLEEALLSGAIPLGCLFREHLASE